MILGAKTSSWSIRCVDCEVAGSRVLFVNNRLQEVQLIITQKLKGKQNKKKPYIMCSSTGTSCDMQ